MLGMKNHFDISGSIETVGVACINIMYIFKDILHLLIFALPDKSSCKPMVALK